MHAYAKIKSFNAVDSSDFLSSLHTCESNHRTTAQPQESKNSDIRNGVTSIESRSGYAAPELRKNLSVSSFSSRSTKVSVLKRAFSAGRSSSVSERYCRIHDQHVALASESDEEDNHISGNRSFNKERKSGKKRIIKACKRIFGL